MQSLFGGNDSQNENDWSFSEIKDEVAREFPMEKQKGENIDEQQVEISEPKQQTQPKRVTKKITGPSKLNYFS